MVDRSGNAHPIGRSYLETARDALGIIAGISEVTADSEVAKRLNKVSHPAYCEKKAHAAWHWKARPAFLPGASRRQ